MAADTGKIRRLYFFRMMSQIDLQFYGLMSRSATEFILSTREGYKLEFFTELIINKMELILKKAY
jgi:hypothetical protein